MLAAELIHYCDDCKRFHLAFYDYNEDGDLMVGDIDGNWEPCDDLPSSEESEAGSRAYLEEVARTGNDYLSQLLGIKTTRKAVWQISFRNWVGSSTHGVLFCGARRRGRGSWVRNPAQLPEYLVEFLRLENNVPGSNTHWVCPEFESIADLRKDACEVKWQTSKVPALEAVGKIELEETLPESTVRRQTSEAAKVALERMVKA